MKCEKLTIINVSWQHMEDIRNYAILFTLTSFQFEAEKVLNDIEIFFYKFWIAFNEFIWSEFKLGVAIFSHSKEFQLDIF